MWKSIGLTAIKLQNNFLSGKELLQQQIRTTFILKRRFPPLLHKKERKPKTLRSRHYVYDLVKDTALEKQQNLEVILTTHVEGLGNVGDKVSVRPNYAYNSLLLPGLAVYASPENVEKYQITSTNEETERFSSANALFTMKSLSRLNLSVVMNKETPWILKPWHIKASFRKCGYFVPEGAITLPETPISGPDMAIENKEFFVTVEINNKEQANVRCRIHHWSTDVTERLPYVFKFWEEPTEALIAEQAPILESLSKKTPVESISKDAMN